MAEPPITVRAIHDSGGGNSPVTRVVIHATCPNVGYPAASGPGAAYGTALYFQNPASGGSAHYVCGVDREEHCVPDGVIAWHAPPNEGSIGIEITAEGGQYANNYSRDQWLSPQVWPAVQRAAARTAELCDRFGLPKVKLSSGDLLAGRHGICGHIDVSQAWHQTDHTDPGPSFPWPEFIALVTGTAPAPVRTPMEDKMRLIRTPDGAIWTVTETEVAQVPDMVTVNALIKVWGLTLTPVEFAEKDKAFLDCDARLKRLLVHEQDWILGTRPTKPPYLYDTVKALTAPAKP